MGAQRHSEKKRISSGKLLKGEIMEFLAGVFIGGILGIVVMAFMIAAKGWNDEE